MPTLRLMPPEDAPGRIADDLWRLGEDELASRASTLSSDDIALIESVASRIVSEDRSTPILFTKAAASAAVEVLKGERRALARARRRRFRTSPYRP